MKNFSFELLAESKKKDTVFTFFTDDKALATAKAKDAASRGFPVLVIKHEGENQRAAKIGPQTDWTRYTKIVVVKTEDGIRLTYKCRNHYETGDNFNVKTPRGVKHVTVFSDTKYISIEELNGILMDIGYLKIIEEVIVKPFDQYMAELGKCNTMKQLEKVTCCFRNDKTLTEDEVEELETESYGIYDCMAAKEFSEAWEDRI